MKMPVIKLLRLPWRWWRRFSIPTVTNRLEVCADTSPTEEVGLDLRKGTSLVLFDRLEQPRLWAFYSHRGNSIGLVKPLLLSLYQMPLQVALSISPSHLEPSANRTLVNTNTKRRARTCLTRWKLHLLIYEAL